MCLYSGARQQPRFQCDRRVLAAAGLLIRKELLLIDLRYVRALASYYRFLTAIAAVSRLVNAKFLLRVTHGSRLLVASGLMLLSYLLLAYSMLA